MTEVKPPATNGCVSTLSEPNFVTAKSNVRDVSPVDFGNTVEGDVLCEGTSLGRIGNQSVALTELRSNLESNRQGQLKLERPPLGCERLPIDL
jgi:hypothetical protein